MSVNRVKYPLKNKLIGLVFVILVPLLCIVIYLLMSLVSYSRAYDKIVSNMTIANNYNINFKEEMDESLYKLVVGYMTFDNIKEVEGMRNPYELIGNIRSECNQLLKITTDRESIIWIQSLLRNIDTLEDRVDDIKANLDQGGLYEENIEMLDNDIYILTELIQDDIQYYIYYQAQNIEQLKINLNQQVMRFIFVCVICVVVVVTVAVAATTIILQSITRPISELCRMTNQIAQGDFSLRIHVQAKDEIGVLADSVNDMSEHLENMVQKLKEDERKMRYADLRLLQEQINPHFLYNTLDTIVWLIEGKNTDKAVKVVISLSEFFRLLLSKGKEYISIEDEEQYIRRYLQIQQARYQDILEYEIAIDPELYPYKIMKMTLQPLVENSLYHGIKYKRSKGKIIISGEKKEDRIYLYIEDNGVGMDEQELEELREKISRPGKTTEKGFGLANVNERIRMNLGAEYGMQILSEKGKGTRVTIVIPALEL